MPIFISNKKFRFFTVKPNNTTLTPNTAVVGTSVVITCKSEGLPEPRYTITRNGTVVSTNKTYAISEVMGSDAGTCTYKCIASNKLGNDSACSNLTVLGKIRFLAHFILPVLSLSENTRERKLVL